MREIRTSGSEGGGVQTNELSLPLSSHQTLYAKEIDCRVKPGNGDGIVARTRTKLALEIHLQDVEAAAEAVDRVDDLALVGEHVVELDRLILRQPRPRRHEGRHFLRLIGVGNVIGA